MIHQWEKSFEKFGAFFTSNRKHNKFKQEMKENNFLVVIRKRSATKSTKWKGQISAAGSIKTNEQQNKRINRQSGKKQHSILILQIESI